MRKLLILSTALTTVGFAASAEQVTVMSWGGAYGVSQVEAYNKPFTAATGIPSTMVDSDNPATPIKAMVEAGNVTIDVADVELSDAIRLCDEGMLEVIDHAALPDGADGTPALEDFVDGALMSECAVANIVWSTVFAYDTTKTSGVKSLADFYDLAKYPGKRGLRKGAKANLEMALMADGVPAAGVYDLLATEAGVARAFAKLDTIKSDVVWWEAGAQPPQLLADGEVVMTTAYNGRIFNAAVGEGKPFEIVWDGQIMDFDLFVIPKGTPNKDAAMKYVAFATGTQPLADQARYISYGPARKSSAPFVGKFKDDKTDMGPQMPTAAANLSNALANDFAFWADRDTELSERFNSWLLSN
ncbi:MAG: ABC transporter substrate-binding protein [Paracoccaceae bacterium]|jgi:putative spermidine/putrescine transport system substrate-binding protein|nr:MAG: spermidine/putrescine ABC transporter substrate-binding protein [Rhodobacter sp. BACL10 MAG-120910-bin24]KRO90974.1 MAG: spermidine/putrescine ABC transporter substrate-binding protein [Rhodobacter sp. BACL10 MAG-121220-bin24]KRP24429.1 MAG: spermidine/putrescine ABC transporter substrate-binding protein [Rhodobacter sp. BACL10 MAG-120419-bin15]MDO7567529.1 ABC transporter substrate-binding protein [Paracoccaceae bacterium]HAG25682.1 spermidine/putrescine ABC transporter substrate-bindi